MTRISTDRMQDLLCFVDDGNGEWKRPTVKNVGCGSIMDSVVVTW